MKRRAAAAIAFVMTAALMATPVRFSLQSITGSAVNRTILVTPDVPAGTLVNSSNFVGLVPIVLNPVSGVVTQELLPWGYTLRVDGWPRSIHIQVPDSTNVQNAVDLVTNGVSYYPVSTLPAGVVTNGQTNATVTVAGILRDVYWVFAENTASGRGEIAFDTEADETRLNSGVSVLGAVNVLAPYSVNAWRFEANDPAATNAYFTPAGFVGSGAGLRDIPASALRIGATNIYPHLTNGVVTWTTTP